MFKVCDLLSTNKSKNETDLLIDVVISKQLFLPDSVLRNIKQTREIQEVSKTSKDFEVLSRLRAGVNSFNCGKCNKVLDMTSIKLELNRSVDETFKCDKCDNDNILLLYVSAQNERIKKTTLLLKNYELNSKIEKFEIEGSNLKDSGLVLSIVLNLMFRYDEFLETDVKLMPVFLMLVENSDDVYTVCV